MSQVEIIDNFLSKEQFDYITHTIPNHIPWDYADGINLLGNDLNNYDWQMVHLFYHHQQHFVSGNFPILQPLLDKINPLVLQRIKLNLNPVANKIVEHDYHIDIEPKEVAKKFTTAIYYINTNNGYTAFEDGTKVESIANRLVKFPAAMKHFGTTCTDQKYRLVLNLNYIEI